MYLNTVAPALGQGNERLSWQELLSRNETCRGSQTEAEYGETTRKLLLSCMRSFYKIIQNTATQRTNSRYVSNDTKVATSPTVPRLSHSPLPPASPTVRF